MASANEQGNEWASAPGRARGDPAVFLDRDGTICEEVGYLNHISRLRIFPQAARAVRRLNQARLPVIVVTNQSGVSRGIFPESLVAQTHARLSRELAGYGAHLDALYYCTHTRADDCSCRKPLPGLLLQAAREHSLDLSRSFVVGDRYADVELAHAAGGRGVLVLTGYGRGEYELHRKEWARQPDYVAQDLRGAVDFILRHLAEDESRSEENRSGEKRPAERKAGHAGRKKAGREAMRENRKKIGRGAGKKARP